MKNLVLFLQLLFLSSLAANNAQGEDPFVLFEKKAASTIEIEGQLPAQEILLSNALVSLIAATVYLINRDNQQVVLGTTVADIATSFSVDLAWKALTRTYYGKTSGNCTTDIVTAVVGTAVEKSVETGLMYAKDNSVFWPVRKTAQFLQPDCPGWGLAAGIITSETLESCNLTTAAEYVRPNDWFTSLLWTGAGTFTYQCITKHATAAQKDYLKSQYIPLALIAGVQAANLYYDPVKKIDALEKEIYSLRSRLKLPPFLERLNSTDQAELLVQFPSHAVAVSYFETQANVKESEETRKFLADLKNHKIKSNSPLKINVDAARQSNFFEMWNQRIESSPTKQRLIDKMYELENASQAFNQGALITSSLFTHEGSLTKKSYAFILATLLTGINRKVSDLLRSEYKVRDIDYKPLLEDGADNESTT